ncbi:MAG: RraA family protein [Litoreibacter sp.]|nr:RraA family protein [Litoreibacter sp.]
MIEEPPRLKVNAKRNRPSEAQIAAFQGVPTGFVVDAMFGAGAMAADISPIGFGRDIECVAAGPALTADNRASDIMGTLAALNFIQDGDVLVAAFEAHQGCAAAGDRVAAMIKNCGGAGFVTDGPMRDYTGIVEVGLPCWCTGLVPSSPFTTGPASVGLPVQIGGQQVASGDMIVADRDGVVVVPFDQIDAVIARLDTVREAELSLDKQLADGLKYPEGVAQLIEGDDVKFV